MSQSNNNIPSTFKITSVKTGENRRFPASVSFSDLKNSLTSIWGEHSFVLTYQDEEDDMITVSTELEFAEALAVARDMNAKVFKFNAYCSDQELREHLNKSKEAPVAQQVPVPPSCQQQQQEYRQRGWGPAVHRGVVCDRSGMSPIVGPRYHVLGADYDLCSAEFEKLPEAERVLFVKIEHPGSSPVPCGAGGSEVKQPQCPYRAGGTGMCPRFATCPRMATNQPMFNMPPTLSVDELILQASIAASLLNGGAAAPNRDGAENAHPFAQVLSSFLDGATVAAVNAATSAKAGNSNGSTNTTGASSATTEKPFCRGENPLADLLTGIRSCIPPPQQQAKTNCSGGGGGGSGRTSPSNKNKKSYCSGGGGGAAAAEDDNVKLYKKKVRENLKKISEECKNSGHPLAKLFVFLDETAANGVNADANAGQSNASADTRRSPPVHYNVECDKCGMNPIVGPRYTIVGSNYDVCAAEFAKLPESERMLYSLISAPGQEPVPCHVQPKKEEKEQEVNSSKAAAAETETTVDEKQTEVEPKSSTTAADSTTTTSAAAATSTEVTEDKKVEEPAPESPDKKYEAELLELASMGFIDRDANVALLDRYQGRVGRVVNFILEL